MLPQSSPQKQHGQSHHINTTQHQFRSGFDFVTVKNATTKSNLRRKEFTLSYRCEPIIKVSQERSSRWHCPQWDRQCTYHCAIIKTRITKCADVHVQPQALGPQRGQQENEEMTYRQTQDTHKKAGVYV